jgi:tripartite-type tricarboxylate transporter receptor subunit TctC
MKPVTRTQVFFIAACLLSAGANVVQGQSNYPSRPVTIIIPYAPGGTTDIEARLYTQKIGERMGQPFVLDYKPGAGATLGAGQAAKAAPDGYTLLMHTATFTVAPALYGSKTPYDPIRDFAPISITTMTPDVFIVNASFPAKNLKEYIAYAAANPGKINFGTSGLGGINHLGGAWLHNATKTKVTFIHYKGGADVIRTVTSGEVHAGVSVPLTVLPQVKAGKMRMLAVTTAERVRFMPDVPTVMEQGVPNYEWSQWVGAFAPVKTPAAIIDRLGAEFARAAKLPDVVKALENGKLVVGSTPEELRKLVAREVPAWRRIVEESGAKLED